MQPTILIVGNHIRFWRSVVNLISKELNEEGFSVLSLIGRDSHTVNDSPDFLHGTESIYRTCADLPVQGYIVLTGTLSFQAAPQRVLELLERLSDKSVISLGTEIPNIPSVVPDNRSGMRALVDHMTRDPQRRNIAFIQGGRAMRDSIERETVFREVLSSKQIPVQEDLIIEGGFKPADAYTQMCKLLERRTDVETVVAASDLMAYSAIQALREYGLQVPDDVIVSGFNNRTDAITCAPPLTSVGYGFAECARTAVHALLTQINGGDANAVIAARDTSDTQVVIRRSSIPPASDLSSSLLAACAQPYLRETQDDSAKVRNATVNLPPPPNPLDQEQASIFGSFRKTIAGPDNTFVEHLAKYLYSTIREASELEWCEQMTIHLEFIVASRSTDSSINHLLPCLSKAREMVAEATGFYRERVAFENERIRRFQDNLHIELASCVEFTDLRIPIEKFVKAVPLRRLYLFFNYQTDERNARSLAKWFTFHELQDSSMNELAFDASKGLPSQLWQELNFGPLVLLPLCAGARTFGYLLIESTFNSALSVENLAISVGNAVNNCLRLQALAQQACELHKRNASLSYLAERDELTGLRNRSGFIDQLNHSIERAANKRCLIEILFIDLDGFKTINDSFGHDVGDIVLNIMAKRLAGLLGGADCCARFGGDEFSVLLESPVGDKSAITLADRVLNVLQVPFSVGKMSITLGASIGVARYGNGSDESVTVVDLLKQADTAMYQAKASGKNRVRFYTESMSIALHKRVKLENAITMGLDNGEFYVKYQPRVNVLTNEILGFEVLARWNTVHDDINPDETLPDVFIPVAEATGSIVEIDHLALTLACKQLKFWKDTFQISTRMSVNMSIMRLQQPGLVNTVQNTLQAFGVDPEMIELEITESGIMDDIENSMRTLNELRLLGVHLSIDDFGTGHSSLAYLKKLPVNCLKIDQSFLKGLANNNFDNFDAKIVQSIIRLANSMGFSVVAEGVENQAQCSFLIDNGCELAQGYLFSEALSSEDAIKLYKHSSLTKSVSEIA